jgi:glucose-6-phosphate 1-dehydrogenase
LVLFGAKGDLVFKTISPALHALVKRGPPNVSLISVARGDGNLEQRRATENETSRPTAAELTRQLLQGSAREDYAEQGGRIVDPILNADTPVCE